MTGRWAGNPAVGEGPERRAAWRHVPYIHSGLRFWAFSTGKGTNLGDNITGNDAANFIDGGFGFDTIDGGRGDDFIFGRDGGGTLRGGASNDRVDGGVENDTLYGGTGNDELRVGYGTNTATPSMAGQAPTRWRAPPATTPTRSTMPATR